MALRRLGTGRISHGFMALLKLAMMNIFTGAGAVAVRGVVGCELKKE